MKMGFVDKVYLPNIVPIEKVLDIDELKSMYDKVVKTEKYYLLYQFVPEKTISLLDIQKIIRRKHKNALFYIIEKKENGNFDIIAGDTLPLNENSFKIFSITLEKINLLKEIDIINEQISEFDKKIVYFIGTKKSEEDVFLKTLNNAEKRKIKEILIWLFPGQTAFQKYKPIIFSLITGILIFMGTKHLLEKAEENVKNYEDAVISQYKEKIKKVENDIKIFQAKNQQYEFLKKMKIYTK
jgi:hypothetical protein